MKVAVIFFLFLIFTVGASAQTGPVAEWFLAKDDGLGNAGEIVEEFSSGDIPIFCVVKMSSFSKAVVKMNFVAESVPRVKSDSLVFTKSYTLKDNENEVHFTGKPFGDEWVAGIYRIEIFVDGKPVGSKSFAIKGLKDVPVETNRFAEPKPKPRLTKRTKKP